MDRCYYSRRFHPSVCTPVDYGKGDSVAIDQQSAQVFNIDPMTGRPICDLTLVMRANNKFEQERILANLPEFQKTYLPDDVSDDEAINFACPRLLQLPSEKADFQMKLAKQKLEAEKAKQLQEYEEKVAAEHDKLFGDYDDDETKVS